MDQVVLASSNPGKLRELEALLTPFGWRLRLQSELGIGSVEETGATFIENALLKARYAAAAAGLPALADDSGIEVDALAGAPGVRSARYAGEGATDEQNLRKLLEMLAGVPPAERTARYRCVIALVRSAADSQPIVAEGVWEGMILDAPRGHGGFGYDPIFVPRGRERSAAELTPAEKNRQSHRAAALAALGAQLAQAHRADGPR
jgi:XTP/dITP diphosphohydrolase